MRRCDVDQPNKCKCGRPLRASSKYGVCASTPECLREHNRRRWAAARPERERKAAERALIYAAERDRLRERILELRKQGWTRLAIRAELHVGMAFVAAVIKDARVPCKICGGPRNTGGVSGICTRNPECERARAAFAVRFKAIRVRGQPSNLTVSYLVSIWSGRCDRQDCGKVLAASGGPRPDVASLDRIIPAKGYMQGNVRWLCGRCNRQKQDMTSVEMRAMLADQLRAEMQAL